MTHLFHFRPGRACCWSAVLFLLAWAPTANAQSSSYATPDEIPGHYTVGIYADNTGTSRELELPPGEQVFDCFIGITGDSTKIFSALVFRLELPLGATLDRPITWAPVPGLKQIESALEGGTQIEFNKECILQTTDLPAIVGRMRIRMSADLDRLEITPLPHRSFGLSVELCDESREWPKPYAEALSLQVTRKRSFLQRLRSLFGG